jgi:hypothetical protein
MSKYFFVNLVFILLLCVHCSLAQAPQRTPVSVNRVENLEPLRGDQRSARDIMNEIRRNAGEPILPENMSDNAKKKILVTKEEKAFYKPFLKENDLKILKIFSAPSCVNKFVVDTSDARCAQAYELIPTSFYSFVWSEYGEVLSDFQITEDHLIAGSKTNIHGFLIDFGEVEMKNFDKKSSEVKMLADYPIAKTSKEAEKQRQELENGFNYQNVNIASKRKLFSNHIYLLRLVSYKLGNDRSSFANQDSVYLFKVGELNKDRVAVILWKKLSEREAPRIKD